MNTRRSFLQQSSALAAGTIFFSAFNRDPFRVSPSDQINIGAIGLNGMGWADLSSALKVPGVNCRGPL